jgi:FtsP/CotA-like multicopper oxidase with cupredoxin domain
MSMMDRDLSDVSGATYTYLMNGANPATHWRGVFKPGEKVRLRFVNSLFAENLLKLREDRRDAFFDDDEPEGVITPL